MQYMHHAVLHNMHDYTFCLYCLNSYKGEDIYVTLQNHIILFVSFYFPAHSSPFYIIIPETKHEVSAVMYTLCLVYKIYHFFLVISFYNRFHTYIIIKYVICVLKASGFYFANSIKKLCIKYTKFNE